MAARGRQTVPVRSLTVRNPQTAFRLSQFSTIRCHGCASEMEIRSDEVKLWRGHTYIICQPCLKAPYICASCRQVRMRLDKARLAMERHFVACSRK